MSAIPRGRSLAWYTVGAVSLACFIAVVPPWQPAFVSGAGIDESWALALPALLGSGIRFGKDVVFTFGPLGFVYPDSYFPGTYGLALTVRLLLAASLWAGLFALGHRTIRSPLLALSWLIGIVALLAIAPSPTLAIRVEALAFALAVTFLVGHFNVAGLPSTIRRSIILGLSVAALIKFTFLLTACAAIGTVVLDQWLQRRTAAGDLVVLLVFLPVSWTVIGGQSASALSSFVRNSLELSAGYTQAMSIDGPPKELACVVAVAALLVACAGTIGRWGAGRSAMLPVVGLSALSLLVLKASFVRHDKHVLIAAVAFPIAALIYLPVSCRLSVAGGTLGFVTASTALAVSTFLFARHADVGFAAHVWRGLRAVPTFAGEMVNRRVHDEQRRSSFEAALARIRAANPIPHTTGSVDVYPWQAAVPIAYGLPYRPRPVFQSYAAYSPYLGELNAAYLRDGHGPDSILFDIGTIDGRLPALDDAPSWPELLSRYDVADATGGFLLLRRAPTARRHVLRPIARLVARRGRRIGLPDARGPVWARVTIRPTVFGRIAAVLFRSPLPSMTVWTKDGREHTFRIVPGSAAAGFLLSPLVEERGQFAFLAMATPSDGSTLGDLMAEQAVTALRIDSGARPRPYESNVRIDLFRLELERQAHTDVPGLRRLVTLHRLVRALSVGMSPELRVGPEGREIVLAHAPAALALPRDAGAARLHVEFGILDGAWTNGGQTDGVEFRVTLGEAGSAAVLWSRRLDPAARPEDRGPQSADIALADAPASQTLLLVTAPGADTRWDWSYWSAADFE